MTNQSNDNPLAPLADEDVALDPRRRDQIEAGLRVQFAGVGGRPRRAALPRWLVVAPVLLLLLAVATVTLVVRDEGAVAALEVRDADNVTVMLPDGSQVENPADGFTLGEGVIVMVGEAGSITIDDVTLGSGAVVRVRDGRLVTDVVVTAPGRPDHLDESGRPTPTVTPPTTRPTADAPPADGPTTRAPPATTTVPSTDTRSADSPTTVRPVDRLPEESGGDRPGTSRPAEERDEAAPPRDVAVALRVSGRDGEIRVVWEASGLDEAWTVHVLRTTDGSTPVDPSAAVTVATAATGELVERRDGLPDDIAALRYRVVVLDDSGAVIASSAVQTLHR
ncbi:MAG: hypothetical protein ACI9C1_001819 [Candidatus Aldehydirespiratoraceae bacterium]